MTNHAVVIAGGGPTGLMLAAELALAGVDVAVVERRLDQSVAGTRAGGLHARAIELLDQRGIAERFLAQGRTMQGVGFAMNLLDIRDFPSRHAYVLALGQEKIERTLAQRAGELGVVGYRGVDVVGFSQDETGVDVSLADGRALRAQYLVGCDGGRSLVRKQAGIAFPGFDAATSYLIAELKTAEEPALGMRRDARGIHGLGKLEDGTRLRFVSAEVPVRDGEPTLDDLRAALVSVYGTDYGVHDVTWISRFTDMTRHAAAYRERRVLLAGDAAHIHSPSGGQGLNLGLYDAFNLGWKLAQVVAGTAPDTLLDTYQAERHPATERALALTMAAAPLNVGDPRTAALRDMIGEMLAMGEPRKRYAGLLSGLDLRYDLGGAHPLVGRRMPDLDIETDEGVRRVYSLLHTARPVLLDFGSTCESGGVRRVHARYAGTWELPVIGAVEAPRAVMIRPDGYVAWVA